MQCRNIDFGHTMWEIYSLCNRLKDDTHLLAHLTNNIIDISTECGNNVHYHSFISSIIYYCDNSMLHYVIDNRCIDNKFLTKMYTKTKSYVGYEPRFYSKLLKLSMYLNSTSLYKYPGYYNLEKYRYMIHTMLLIINVQQVLPHPELALKSLPQRVALKSLPKCIIKHLIIPFVYQ